MSEQDEFDWVPREIWATPENSFDALRTRIRSDIERFNHLEHPFGELSVVNEPENKRLISLKGPRGTARVQLAGADILIVFDPGTYPEKPSTTVRRILADDGELRFVGVGYRFLLWQLSRFILKPLILGSDS